MFSTSCFPKRRSDCNRYCSDTWFGTRRDGLDFEIETHILVAGAMTAMGDGEVTLTRIYSLKFQTTARAPCLPSSFSGNGTRQGGSKLCQSADGTSSPFPSESGPPESLPLGPRGEPPNGRCATPSGRPSCSTPPPIEISRAFPPDGQHRQASFSSTTKKIKCLGHENPRYFPSTPCIFNRTTPRHFSRQGNTDVIETL